MGEKTQGSAFQAYLVAGAGAVVALVACFFADFTFTCLTLAFLTAGLAAASLAIVAAVAFVAASVFATGVSGVALSEAAKETDAKLAAMASATRVLIDFMVSLRY